MRYARWLILIAAGIASPYCLRQAQYWDLQRYLGTPANAAENLSRSQNWYWTGVILFFIAVIDLVWIIVSWIRRRRSTGFPVTPIGPSQR